MSEQERAGQESATVDETKRHAFWVDVAIRLVKDKPLGMVGLVLVAALFFTGIFADFHWLTWVGVPAEWADTHGLAPEGHNVMHFADRLTGPSAQYPLGTDHLGRDVLSRIIHGARLSMIIGVVATALSITISTAIGMTSAYFGGWFDLLVQRFVDAWISFPGLIMLITMMAILGPGLITILIVLGVFSGIGGGRFARSLVFAIKENMYVKAAEAIGARRGRILLHHLLPNIMPMLIVLFTIGMGANIMAEAGLSFLGLGLPPPYPSWGSMISGEGRRYALRAPLLAVWPGATLTLAVFGINMLGDALRDLLDPRLRGGLGNYRIDKVRGKLAKAEKSG